MIVEAVKKGREGGEETCQADGVSLRTLLALSVATSIDALATGIILPSAVGANTLPLMIFSVCAIGVITFFICMACFSGRPSVFSWPEKRKSLAAWF